MSEEKTKKPLVARLKNMLVEAQLREAANAIDKQSVDLLGPDNFVYRKESEILAAMPLEKLDEFVAMVKRVRLDLETEYALAAQKLGEEHEEDN